MDFPNPEEEYEIMYADELEVMREMEEEEMYEPPCTKSKRSLDFTSPRTNDKPSKILQNVGQITSNGYDVDTISLNEDTLSQDDLARSLSAGEQSFTSLTRDVHNTEDDSVSEFTVEETKKRRVEELFGDISDLDDASQSITPKKKKLDTEQTSSSAGLLEKILAERERAQAKFMNSRLIDTVEDSIYSDYDTVKISRRVPKWPFVAVTSEDGDRWYVRIRSEQALNEEIGRMAAKTRKVGLLTVPYELVWRKANELLEKRLECEQVKKDAEYAKVVQDHLDSGCDTMSEEDEDDDSAELWVEKYKPKCYLELLSDESINRTLLHWLKLWDKVVFGREPKVKLKHKDDKKHKQFMKNKKAQFIVDDDLDDNGCPKQKLALLCGAPGLGKTTLAHMVAKLAGYKAVEMNASDDRSPETFRLQLENATQMRSVMGEQPKPNCLIIDEIDGAPAASIEFLIKYVTGKDVGKNRGKKKGKGSNSMKRPVICICNDLYVPALRPLRQMALVINFPPTASARLAQRLMEVARKQHIRTDLSAMLALVEKTQNDIRSCLGVLHFFKSKKKEVRLTDIHRSNIGQKDMQKGLFVVWQEIFQIPREKQRSCIPEISRNNVGEMPNTDSVDFNLGTVTQYSRMRSILHTVQAFGDYERLIQGVYENFLNMNLKDSRMEGVAAGMDWFCLTDVLTTEIYSSQNYILMPYISYAFVIWHFLFAARGWPKINYPNVGYEMSVKDSRNKQLLQELMKGLCPHTRVYTQADNLLLDTLAMLLRIIVINLRPVNTQLYSPREKAELNEVISIMIDYNLSYIQERTPEGSYVYNLDPNVEDLCVFPDTKPDRALSYSGKQLIARELDLEKVRRAEAKLKPEISEKIEKVVQSKANDKNVKTDQNEKADTFVPNHLQSLTPKAFKCKKKEVQCTDFFGRVVERKDSSEKKAHTDEVVKSDIWFHFKEGFSNAVRRPVKMRELLDPHS